MIRRTESIAQQNIGTAGVNFDYTRVSGFNRGTFLALRASDHFVTITEMRVSGTSSVDLMKAHFDEASNRLGQIVFPTFLDTLRVTVAKRTGSSSAFAGTIIFDDAPFLQAIPANLVALRTSPAASATTTVLTAYPCTLYSRLGIVCRMASTGRIDLDWNSISADVTAIPVLTFAAAGVQYVEVPVCGASFDLFAVNTDAGGANTMDISVSGLP